MSGEQAEMNDRLQCRIDDLEKVCGEAYQVVAQLAYRSALFDELNVIKMLDNLSDAASGDKPTHEDVLPLLLPDCACKMSLCLYHKIREANAPFRR